MQPYGKRKHKRTIEGHQNCGICQPPTKNPKHKARSDAKAEIKRQIEPDECMCPNPKLHRKLAECRPIDPSKCYRED